MCLNLFEFDEPEVQISYKLKGVYYKKTLKIEKRTLLSILLKQEASKQVMGVDQPTIRIVEGMTITPDEVMCALDEMSGAFEEAVSVLQEVFTDEADVSADVLSFLAIEIGDWMSENNYYYEALHEKLKLIADYLKQHTDKKAALQAYLQAHDLSTGDIK